MIVALVAAATGQAQTPVGRDIHRFCHEQRACIARQQESARHFLGMMVIFDGSKPAAERCLRSAKAGGLVDWLPAERCLRAWSAGRKPILPDGR
jgi:hypothetical protein